MQMLRRLTWLHTEYQVTSYVSAEQILDQDIVPGCNIINLHVLM